MTSLVTSMLFLNKHKQNLTVLHTLAPVAEPNSSAGGVYVYNGTKVQQQPEAERQPVGGSPALEEDHLFECSEKC